MADTRKADLEANIKRAQEKIERWQAELDARDQADQPKSRGARKGRSRKR